MTRAFSSWKRYLSTCCPWMNPVSPTWMISTLRNICLTTTPRCLSLMSTPWRRYTSWTSSSKNDCRAFSPRMSRMSCGSIGPSHNRSDASTRSPSRTNMCLLIGTRCLNSCPKSSSTMTTRLPFTTGPNFTRPSTWANTDGVLGRRASNSSPTLGKPPVMSLVLTLSLSSLAMMRPFLTRDPSSTLRYEEAGR
ncbi:hypothetical protein SDC9_179860 [bioreactor metagenome]|uniref:Uncharacterized protein n=1 Tax=bioreactor metagenome TaxID=1076179 RepID=A0A645H210_9ZZZZ